MVGLWRGPEGSWDAGGCRVTENIDGLLHGCGDPGPFRVERYGRKLEPLSHSRFVEGFQDPTGSVKRVNPEFDPRKPDDDPYSVNCADCTRCFESTWRGYEVEAAGCVNPRGEPVAALEEWAGEKFDATSPIGLRRALKRGGHGSSAVVVSASERRAHAYNVVNYRGRVVTVDAQRGEVHRFSRRTIHPHFKDFEVTVHGAMGWDGKGKRIL